MVSLFERLGQLSPPPATKKAEKPLPDQKLQQAQLMLNWIQRWAKDIICIRDVRQYGPNSLRNPESAIDAAEVLVKSGWLEPAELHRYDMRKWRIIRRPPIVAPKVY
jgi:hypothetical protein